MRKTPVILSIVIIILLVIIGIITFYPFITQSIGGFTSLSISDVKVVDNGDFIRIYGVSNGAERISIDFSSSKINQYIQDDGYKATKSVTGEITLDEQIKRFPLIKKTDQNFVELKTQKVGLISSCPSLSGYTNFGSTISLSLSKVCFYKKGIGTNSDFSGQSLRDSTVSFNIGGSTGVLNSVSGKNTITLNDGKTKVEWVGDLSNYNQVSAPFSYSALFHGSEFQKLIDDDSYSLSMDEAVKFTSCMGKTSTFSLFSSGGIFSLLSNLKTNSQIDSCINTYNNRITNILVDRTSSYVNSINANEVGFTSNALEVDLKTADAFPTFIITLDADKVGIVELSGKPKIISCVSNKQINSGDTFSTSINVKNDGSSDGSFYGTVNCLGGATASGIISEQFVRAGSTVNMPIQITGQNTQADTTKSATCTYKIIDRKSGASDSCSSELDVEYQSGLICDPNSIKCIDADTLRTCSADGKTYNDEKCDLGCKSLADGTGQCKVEDDDNGSIECPFGQEYREEGSRFLWIFPGSSAGCYTSSWVYFVIFLAFITFITFIIIIVRKITR